MGDWPTWLPAGRFPRTLPQQFQGLRLGDLCWATLSCPDRQETHQAIDRADLGRESRGFRTWPCDLRYPALQIAQGCFE